METLMNILFLSMSVAANLLMMAIFFSRITERPKIERISGVAFILLGIPAAWIIVTADVFWFQAYLVIFIAFVLLEAVLDYILRIPFRKDRRILAPYLVLYLLSFWGFIGIAFTIDITYGAVISALYIGHLALMIYSERASGKRKSEQT